MFIFFERNLKILENSEALGIIRLNEMVGRAASMVETGINQL